MPRSVSSYRKRWISPKEGIATDHDEIKALQDWPKSKSKYGVWTFWAFSVIINDFGKIANFDAASPEKKLSYWKPECKQVFSFRYECLITAPILTYLKAKYPFVLDNDYIAPILYNILRAARLC